MAEFIVLFDAAADPETVAINGQIEAWLPVVFPEHHFRFGLAIETDSVVAVTPIAGRNSDDCAARRVVARGIAMAIEEWLVSRVSVSRA